MKLPAEQQALVTATYSRRVDLQLATGEIVAGRIKGKKLRPVCGDLVQVQEIPNEPELLITGIQPRDNELSRPNAKGQAEALAANLSFLAVVAADPPAPDWFIVDRYLSAAEIMNIAAAVIFNKTDLDTDDQKVQAALGEYAAIGYPIVQCSAKTGTGIAAVQELLVDHTAIIVGQSGVGKSSIINRLIENANQRIAAVSSGSGEGRHTTVSSLMLQLPGGGAVIDSPGVRDYAPAARSTSEVIAGFREIALLGVNCRFANCMHLREPGCAVKAALTDEKISARRYESYKRLQALTRKLTQGRH